jgi:hypothetical protein
VLSPKYLLVVDALFAVVYLGMRLAGSPSWVITLLSELNGEGTVASWYSSSKLLLLGVLWIVIALRLQASGVTFHRIAWLVPAVFVTMSADEGGHLHETMGALVEARLFLDGDARRLVPRTGVWIFIIGLPAIAACGWLLRSVSRQPAFSCLTRGKCLAGFVIFFTSAVGI